MDYSSTCAGDVSDDGLIWIGVHTASAIGKANAFVAFNVITRTVATGRRGRALVVVTTTVRLLIMTRAASPAATVGSSSTVSIKQ